MPMPTHDVEESGRPDIAPLSLVPESEFGSAARLLTLLEQAKVITVVDRFVANAFIAGWIAAEQYKTGRLSGG